MEPLSKQSLHMKTYHRWYPPLTMQVYTFRLNPSMYKAILLYSNQISLAKIFDKTHTKSHQRAYKNHE